MNHPPSFILEKSARLLKAPINVSCQNDSHERDARNAEEDEKQSESGIVFLSVSPHIFFHSTPNH
jgi:hypothetical protein